MSIDRACYVCVDRIWCSLSVLASVLAEIHRGTWGEAPAVQKGVQERDRQGHRAQRRGTGSVVARAIARTLMFRPNDSMRCALLCEFGYVQNYCSMFSRAFFGVDQARDDRSHQGLPFLCFR